MCDPKASLCAKQFLGSHCGRTEPWFLGVKVLQVWALCGVTRAVTLTLSSPPHVLSGLVCGDIWTLLRSSQSQSCSICLDFEKCIERTHY